MGSLWIGPYGSVSMGSLFSLAGMVILSVRTLDAVVRVRVGVRVGVRIRVALVRALDAVVEGDPLRELLHVTPGQGEGEGEGEG